MNPIKAALKGIGSEDESEGGCSIKKKNAN